MTQSIRNTVTVLLAAGALSSAAHAETWTVSGRVELRHQFAEYEQKTDRQIPVILLEPRT